MSRWWPHGRAVPVRSSGSRAPRGSLWEHTRLGRRKCDYYPRLTEHSDIIHYNRGSNSPSAVVSCNICFRPTRPSPLSPLLVQAPWPNNWCSMEPGAGPIAPHSPGLGAAFAATNSVAAFKTVGHTVVPYLKDLIVAMNFSSTSKLGPDASLWLTRSL